MPAVAETQTLSRTTTNRAAWVSLVAGIISFVVMPFLGGVVAIVAGHLALDKLGDINGTDEGGGAALLGLALGYGNVILTSFATTIGLLVFGAMSLSSMLP